VASTPFLLDPLCHAGERRVHGPVGGREAIRDREPPADRA
jgi:hypothetical protein